MFFLPMPGDQEWTQGYVVEYLRPCLPAEVPRLPPAQENSIDTEVKSVPHELLDYNTNNSAEWRSHEQANISMQNVLHETRKRKPRGLFTANTQASCSLSHSETRSMLHKTIYKSHASHMNYVPLDKGKWHIVQFWGNDYTTPNSFPTTSPVFYPCFQSLKDLKLIFTNVREQKEPYTGKAQDWGFRIGTEVFDDGERQQHKGKRLTQESWKRLLTFANRYQKRISFDCA